MVGRIITTLAENSASVLAYDSPVQFPLRAWKVLHLIPGNSDFQTGTQGTPCTKVVTCDISGFACGCLVKDSAICLVPMGYCIVDVGREYKLP